MIASFLGPMVEDSTLPPPRIDRWRSVFDSRRLQKSSYTSIFFGCCFSVMRSRAEISFVLLSFHVDEGNGILLYRVENRLYNF